MSTIAFIGLGNMGGPMAANLVKAGLRVVGFDLAPASLDQARADGVAVAGSAAEAVADAEAVVTMLPAGRHVMQVWGEILSSVPAGALMIDSSTIDVDSARRAHGLAQECGLDSLDAPVSGGVGGATAGTLTFMCGGGDAAFARAEPILSRMGRRVVHCGEAGAGQAAKICNNMILGISMIGVAEAFVLAEKLGLSHQALFDVASAASGQCWSLTSYCPVPGPVPASPANNGYKPGFAAALMLKDLKLAQEAALASGALTPLGAEAAQLYGLFAAAGHAERDFSAIIEFVRGEGGEAPMAIDLNADLGEGFGPWSMGDDAAMMDIVTTVNVACGFHAGDPDIMRQTAELARDKGVAVGAHPGFADLKGFGRRAQPGLSLREIENLVAYQVGAFQAVAALAGHPATHVKTHGALGNACNDDDAMALAVGRGIKAADSGLLFMVMPGLATERAAERLGLACFREIYADRTYDDSFNLTDRRQPGAVIHDPEVAAEAVLRMVGDGEIISIAGKRLKAGIDSVCVHGDNPAAVALARTVRTRLEAAGFTVAAYRRP